MKKIKIPIKIIFVLMSVVLFVAVAVISFAQTKKSDKGTKEAYSEKTKATDEARLQIAKSPLGTLVLSKVELENDNWELTKGNYRPKMKGESAQVTRMSFEKGTHKIHVSIYAYESIEEAKESFNGVRSHGYSVPINIGDFGEKIYVDGSGLALLRFKIGNLKISIGGTNDEKLAEKFARLVAETLSGHSSN